ncbi:MAG: sulfotransferase [Myxococcota bacterium]
MSRPAPLFIVGTGRCGSTLISKLMDAHPRVLSVSELLSFTTDLGSLIPQAFDEGPVDGEHFWSVVSAQVPRSNQLLAHGLRMPEVLYPFERGRYRMDAGVPAISFGMLPWLSRDPDALFDELEAHMRPRGPASMAEHYRHLFEHLMHQRGHQTWVERSGGSLRIIQRLVDAFPEARFVHLVRDGRNTAISMSRHIGFRMALVGFSLLELLGVDPWESDDRSEVDDLEDDLAALLPETFTAEAFHAYDISPTLCGHYWSGEIRRGVAVLKALPPQRVMTLRYEDLITDSRACMTQLGGVLDVGAVEDSWIEAGLAEIGQGRSQWQQLDPRDQRELDDACAPGFAALAEIGLHWPRCEG